MKPIFIFVPYWMGDFSSTRLGLARHTWRVVTEPDLSGSPTERMGQLDRLLADEVAEVRAAGQLPVVIAGDCTASIGVLAGLQRQTPELTLVWYDAHGDFNTHQTTPSGFIGGMPLAMLCGRGEQTIMQGAGAQPQPEAEVILTDGRDLDPGEAEAVAESDLTHLPDVADLTTYQLPSTRPLYIHFDSDVLPLEHLSAVSYPAEGGASLAAIEASLAHLAESGQVAALSVTMWNPELDTADRPAERLVLGLVERFLARLQASS